MKGTTHSRPNCTDAPEPRWSSVSRHIILAIALELVAVSFVLNGWMGLTFWASLAWAVSLIVLVRAVLAMLSFALAWWFRSEPHPPPLTRTQTVNLVARELWAFMQLFFFFHPFEPILSEHDGKPPTVTANDPVVLFVHGFFSNAGFWWFFKRYFRRRGLTALYSINLEPVFADLDDYANQLAGRIEQVCTITGRSDLTLVAHSMGGLVCRAYLNKYGGRRVRAVTTLGSPHHGTVFAFLLCGRNLSQMRPHNEWLNRLNETVSSAPITTCFSFHDNIVAPQDSARLKGATEETFIGIGHLSMAFSSRIMDRVLKQIRTNSPRSDKTLTNQCGRNKVE